MKHASAKTIESLTPLLVRVRAISGLAERKPGTFYLRAGAFLHFHEDPAGLFADAKLDLVQFTRFAVNTTQEQDKLLAAVTKAVSAANSSKRNDR